MHKFQQFPYSYLIAAAALALALLVRWAFDPILGDLLPFITLYAAVAVTVWIGGWRPALLVTLLSYVAVAWWFIEPRPDSPVSLSEPRAFVGMILYFATCAIVIMFGDGMRRAQKRAEAAALEARTKQAALEHEVAEHRRTEEALRAAEGELDIIVSRTPLLLTRCTKDLRYAYVNQASARFLQLRPEDIIGRRIDEVVGREALAAIMPYVERVLGGEPVEFEMEVPYTFPGRRFMHATYVPHHDPQGRVIGWVASIMDVTVQKEAELALRQSEERFRLMADAAPVLIWISDTDKLCTWFNKQWLNFVGRSMEQELGNGWTENVHPDDFDSCLQTYVQSFDQRRPFSMEYRLRRHDGEYRWVLDTGIPLYDASGEFTGYIGSCIDITDRRQAEEALMDADRRKDEFLATLAHELRNPLAPIRNAVQILRFKMPPDPDPDLAWADEVIERQITQMARLIDDLIDVARITRGRMELRKERVDLAEVLRSAVETSRPLIDGPGHVLTVDLPSEPIALDADLTRLAQAFANLLNNAATYSEPPGRIFLGARRDGSDVIVSVRDTGIGIPPEMLSRIFESFTQVDRSLERTQSGLGIGLMLVKQLVELHGGSIDAHSAGPGTGSEFTVRLPVAAPAGPAEAPPPDASRPVDGAHARAGAAPLSAGHRPRILVADDNQDAARSLCKMLGLLGYETRIAFDGREALAAAAEFRPDVALLDVGMPELNGYEVAASIRRETWGKDMLLMAVTGWGQVEDQRRTLESGFDRHLVKPVDPTDLAALIQASRS